jgi:hypothetical protein
VLDEIDALDLRAESDTGLIHTAFEQRQAVTELENGEEAKTPSEGPATCAFLSPVGSVAAEEAAARGVQASWWLRLPLGQPTRPGQRWRVIGQTKRVKWQRQVTVTSTPAPASRIHVLVTAVDDTLHR